MPPRSEIGGEFLFRNSYLGSILICEYRQGEGVFKSDSASTIAIIKQVITKQATLRSVSLQVKYAKYGQHSTYAAASAPKVERHIAIAGKIELIEAMREMSTDAVVGDFFDEKLKDVLQNGEDQGRAWKRSKRMLHGTLGIITDLYIDAHLAVGRVSACTGPRPDAFCCCLRTIASMPSPRVLP